MPKLKKQTKPNTSNGVIPVVKGWEFMCCVCKTIYPDDSRAADCIANHLEEMIPNAVFQVGDIIVFSPNKDTKINLVVGYNFTRGSNLRYQLLEEIHSNNAVYYQLRTRPLSSMRFYEKIGEWQKPVLEKEALELEETEINIALSNDASYGTWTLLKTVPDSRDRFHNKEGEPLVEITLTGNSSSRKKSIRYFIARQALLDLRQAKPEPQFIEYLGADNFMGNENIRLTSVADCIDLSGAPCYLALWQSAYSTDLSEVLVSETYLLKEIEG